MAERKKETDAGEGLVGLETVRIEAVVQGSLMTLTFGQGTTPAAAIEAIKAHDSQARFREDFPRGGRGPGRETKEALALCINGRRTDGGTFIEVGCRGGGDDFTVAVSRKGVDAFVADLRARAKLTPEHLGKLDALGEKPGSAFVPLGEAEQFTVCYWTADDGRKYLDKIGTEVAS